MITINKVAFSYLKNIRFEKNFATGFNFNSYFLMIF